ncbi:17643_t:CDS:1, partial [Racocetra persica]
FIPAFHTFKEAAFAGYFGPIGIGAIFLAMTVEKEISRRLNDELRDIDDGSMLRIQEITFPIVAFIVLSSVIVHGITVPILNFGSRIDIERFPSIASISSQVARLPVIDFVESLTLERDNKGRVRKKEKMKAEFAPKNKDEFYQDVHKENMEEEQNEGNGVYIHNHIETDLLIENEQNDQDNVNSVDYHWLHS